MDGHGRHKLVSDYAGCEWSAEPGAVAEIDGARVRAAVGAGAAHVAEVGVDFVAMACTWRIGGMANCCDAMRC